MVQEPKQSFIQLLEYANASFSQGLANGDKGSSKSIGHVAMHKDGATSLVGEDGALCEPANIVNSHRYLSDLGAVN